MHSATENAIRPCLFAAAMTAVCLGRGPAARSQDTPLAGAKSMDDAATDHDRWPCWSGPRTTFVAPPTGIKLVNDLNKAKLVWQSDEITPMGKAHAARSGQYTAGRHGGNQQGKPSGGGGSVIVTGRRVYLSYYLPSGSVIAPEVSGGRSFDEDSRRISADDIVLCLDAETGKTVWKQVFEDNGVNIQAGKSPGYSGLTPCAIGKRIYALGTMMRIYCLDAKTGELVWETPTPRATEALEAAKQKALQEKRLAGHPYLAKQGGKNLISAGGVLLVPVQRDLLGVDGQTGDVLWTVAGALGGTATPTRWTHAGNDYVIAANDEGTIRCIEPRSGKVTWTIEDAGPNNVNVAVEGDLLVARAGSAEFPREGRKPEVRGLLGAWRISPERATMIWKHEDARYALNHLRTPVLAEGYLYFSCDRGPVLCVEAATGKVVAEAEVPVPRLPGACSWAEGLLFVETDGSHMSMNLHMIKADPSDLRQLGETWLNPHPPTTSYVPAMCHAHVDGRLYVRGADGVYCYDLRR